jgi:hypothetical protein
MNMRKAFLLIVPAILLGGCSMFGPKQKSLDEFAVARNAPLVMKKIIIPPPNRNMTRRNGSASALTAGAALTRSRSTGERKYPAGATRKSEIPIAVRKA